MRGSWAASCELELELELRQRKYLIGNIYPKVLTKLNGWIYLPLSQPRDT